MTDTASGSATLPFREVRRHQERDLTRLRRLPTAWDPALLGANRLRGLLAILEECGASEEPFQFPQHMYNCGCGFCGGVVAQPPTFAEMMAVVRRRKGARSGDLTERPLTWENPCLGSRLQKCTPAPFGLSGEPGGEGG